VNPESTSAGRIDLIASFWTIAGPVGPLRGEREISPWGLRERVEEAAKAGFSGVGLVHEDLMEWQNRLGGLSEVRRILEGNGIRHVEVEMLADWWFPEGERRWRSDIVRGDLIRAAEEFGARHLKVGAAIDGGEWAVDVMAEAFAELCEEAAQVGARVALEPMPFSNVRTPAEGLELVRAADHRNGGLIIDIWHVGRAGVPYHELRDIPAERIVAVELNDAPAEPADSSLVQDTINGRLFCGEGDLDVPAFIAAIDQAGFEGPYGVEIISHQHRDRPLQAAAEQAYATAMAQFER
jgi:sugar phosphate isomerase/epimerase